MHHMRSPGSFKFLVEEMNGIRNERDCERKSARTRRGSMLVADDIALAWADFLRQRGLQAVAVSAGSIILGFKLASFFMFAVICLFVDDVLVLVLALILLAARYEILILTNGGIVDAVERCLCPWQGVYDVVLSAALPGYGRQGRDGSGNTNKRRMIEVGMLLGMMYFLGLKLICIVVVRLKSSRIVAATCAPLTRRAARAPASTK